MEVVSEEGEGSMSSSAKGETDSTSLSTMMMMVGDNPSEPPSAGKKVTDTVGNKTHNKDLQMVQPDAANDSEDSEEEEGGSSKTYIKFLAHRHFFQGL